MVYRLINHAGCGKNMPVARDLRTVGVFFQHPKWFIMPINHKTCGLLLLYNNSEDMQNFHGFTGTIHHG